MEALALRILNIPLFAPMKKFAFRLALDLRNGRGRRGAERALRRAVRTSARASGPVDNWNRETLVAAASISRSRAAREYVFRLLSRRGNFVSAQVVANQRPFESYSLEMQVSIVRNGFNGTDGVRSDERLTSFVAQNLAAIGGLPLSVLKEFLYALRFSGFTTLRKNGILDSIGLDVRVSGEKRAALDSAIAEVNRISGQIVDIPARFYEALGSVNPSNANVETVRAFWNQARYVANRTEVVAFMSKALESPKIALKHLPFLCRALDDDNILAVVSEDEVFARLCELPQVFSFRTNNAEGSLAPRVLERAKVYWFDVMDKQGRSKFDLSSIDVQNTIIRLLHKVDLLGVADKQLESTPFSDTLQDIAFARATRSFMRDDFASALTQFEEIVRENPNHRQSWMGVQWSSVRATGELDRVESLRRTIGRGAIQAGRPTMNREFDDDIVMTARQWRGIHDRVPLASINRSWRELEQVFGDRWFDFSRFPAPDPKKDLLLIPVYGVSDEVREAYHYGELANQYRSVTVVCDPRLQNILEASFPSIRFVPFARRVKQLQIDDYREDPVKDVPAILANYVPDSLRELLKSPQTTITPSQNFVGRRLAEHDYELRIGAYLTNGRQRSKRSPSGKKRVGVLWRSHLTSGFRGLMYMSFDDVKPLFEMEEIEFVSLQHRPSSEEKQHLDAFGVEQPEVDLFNDFDGMSDVIGSLDLVIGLSTFPIEFAAALGCPVWMLGFSPENYYLRTLGGTRRDDILTANSRVIAPDVPRFWLSRENGVEETINVVKRELRSLADQR